MDTQSITSETNKLQYNEEKYWKTVVETLLHLRSKQGCPWDQLQNTESIIVNLIEEVSEFIDALHNYNAYKNESTERDQRKKELIEECGDVHLVLMMMMIILQEEDDRILSSIFKNLNEKLIRRHPHVYFNTQVKNNYQLQQQWHDIKYHVEGKREPDKLSDYKPYLHILERTKELQKRLEKVSSKEKQNTEQIQEELVAAINSLEEHFEQIPEDSKVPSPESANLAVGKAIYTLVNLSRSLRVSPTTALTAYVSRILNEE